MSLKLWKNDELVLDNQFNIKDRLLRSAQVRIWDIAYLKVNYRNGFCNEGDYPDSKLLSMALSCFTEKSLTDDFYE